MRIAWVGQGVRPASEVGGKGHGLMRLAAAGVDVPSAFVINSAVFEKHMDVLASETQRVTSTDSERSFQDHVLAELRNRIGEIQLEEALVREISDGYAALCRTIGREQVSVAVRSSASGEDGIFATYAGQYDTFLCLRGVPAILDAVCECWASTYGDRAYSYYRRMTKINAAPLPTMAVIVQTMVAARASGVVSTCNPVSGLRGEVIIEAIVGLAEPLASGKVTPDFFRLDKQNGSVIESRLFKKTSRLVCLNKGGRASLALGPNEVDSSALTPNDLKNLWALAVRVERLMGLPVEIEFAVTHNNRLWAIQARPITAMRGPKPRSTLHLRRNPESAP
jgi:phosphoenolpyruvate synthase/pyruvate phosphate dikinase